MLCGMLALAPRSPAAEVAVGPSRLAAVMAADDERVAASTARDRARLEAVLSPELRYAHSSGAVDTQQSYIASILEGRSVYETYTNEERTFSPVGDDVMLMSGRVVIDTRDGGKPLQLHLGYLAVWRLEEGRWRFRAWQSCRLPPVQ